TRIGYPNEHLAGDSDTDIASPVYATAVGLVMNALQQQKKNIVFKEEPKQQSEKQNTANTASANTATESQEDIHIKGDPKPTEPKRERKSFLEKWSEKLKDFLDNAE